MGTHSDFLTNSTRSSAKLITARKWGAVSPSTCAGGRLVYAPRKPPGKWPAQRLCSHRKMLAHSVSSYRTQKTQSYLAFS